MIRSPHTDSDFFRPRNPPPPVAPQNVKSCCIWDSVQSVEQPGALGGAVAGPNLVQNGGFEQTTGLDPNVFNENTGIDDWVISGDNPAINLVMPQNVQTTTAVQYLWGPTNASPINNGLTVSPAGGNFIAQDGDYYYHGTISQTINGLTPGKKYDVSFYWAVAQAVGFGVPGGNVDNQYQVSLGAETQSTADVTVPYQGFSGWMPGNFVFTATDVSEDLSFMAIGGVAIGIPPMALLDGVSMTSVPEPSTWAMLLTGFGDSPSRRDCVEGWRRQRGPNRLRTQVDATGPNGEKSVRLTPGSLLLMINSD